MYPKIIKAYKFSDIQTIRMQFDHKNYDQKICYDFSKVKLFNFIISAFSHNNLQFYN